MIFPVKRLADLGFAIVATAGTGEVLRRYGVECEIVPKHYEDRRRPRRRRADRGRRGRAGGQHPAGLRGRPRSTATRSAARRCAADIPCITTVPGAAAAVMGIEALIRRRDDGAPAAGAARRAERGGRELARPAGACGPAAVPVGAATPRRRTSGRWRRLVAGSAAAGAAAAGGAACGRRRRPVTVFGVDFPNPVGLAAGMDKNGVALRGLAGAGLRVRRGRHGHRARPAGQPAAAAVPAAGSGAIVNRMGFNNAGAAALADAAAARWGRCRYPLGISLGKSKVTPLERGGRGLRASLRTARPVRRLLRGQRQLPNTPGLRSLQDRGAARRAAAARSAAGRTDRPLW